jgi:hypothetical protein
MIVPGCSSDRTTNGADRGRHSVLPATRVGFCGCVVLPRNRQAPVKGVTIANQKASLNQRLALFFPFFQIST